jgi:hypothetical protein
VLVQSKHGLVETFRFTRPPDPEEANLDRVLLAWDRILERCLDTLEVTDHKDTLKWWASPKNEVASQKPFELPQNSKTIDKYSGAWQRFLCYIIRTAPKEWGEDTGK